ncbi:hypothetical protein [Mesorhizobium sp.]|uniref:hypothetical protein n=1 Tax=Mesorhizobium sp. TaxID=1871066 RepID=UPI001204E61E|nr:hypothetical protein [Mesorhizobium sp.]TIO07063.1 MAG: hypothetical protein E5X88_20345 [Mesorhizobium sp.]TIO35956.1 MAG: hypothetical protein E5X89_07810 [Mesorhizobium sp.]TIP07716.1 MAG: hypothetical protein E5X73_35635 [Mesorhizobium sp.]
MSRLPDDVLGDIGISCDEIMCALRSRAIRHAEAGAAGTTIERTRIASASIPKRLAAGSGYASAEIPLAGPRARDRALHCGFDKQRRADGTFERHYTCDPKD